MAKIEVGRYSDQLRRLFGMKGVEVVASELSPEISPVVVLEDNAPDLQFLKAVRLCGSADTAAAAAGFFGRVRLRNPATSGVIATVTRSTLSSTSTQQYTGFLIVTATDLASIATGVILDGRWQGAVGGTALRTSFQSIAGAASGSRVLDQQGGQVGLQGDSIVLIPGDALDFQLNTLNLELHFWLRWSERRLPELET